MHTEKNYLSDVLLYEVNPRWSRKRVVVGVLAAAAAIGTVLGKVTATGVYVPLDLAANDGSEDAAAVLAEHLDISADEQLAIVIKRGAGVNAGTVVWPVGITTNQKAAAVAQLEALGIDVESVL